MRGVAVCLLATWIGALAACGPSVEPPVTTEDGGENPDGCNAPMRSCGERCVNNQTDNDHCGTCNNPCTGGAVCSGGQCVRACGSGLLSCEGNCIDPATDEAHCGECGNACGADRECRGGDCACAQGFSSCGGQCVDVQNNADHCGICDRSCGMERSCENGSCSCAVGEMRCGAECVDPLSDSAHCGDCNVPCAADQICSGGECQCATGTREANCENGTDDDCDQLIDCNDPDCQGMARFCSGVCGAGVEICQPNGSWGSCEGGDGSAEICGDGIDQDCNGSDLRAPDMWEPNDDCASCPMISGNDPNVFLNAGFDSVADPVDCFRFQGTDDFGPIREFVYLTLDQIPSGHDYDLYFYRDQAACASGSALAQSAAAGNVAESISWGEELGSDDSSTYFVRVVRYAGRSCTAQYRLTINGLR